MGKILIPHFDTKTGKHYEIEPEEFENTLVQYLFPNVNFSLGTVYDQTVLEDLTKFTDKTLQFSNGEQFYFADSLIRDEVFPVASYGAAYGSLLFTNNQNFVTTKAKILVVNHETGENSVSLNAEVAKNLVADCFGIIDENFHANIGGQAKTAFQFRLGIKVQKNEPTRIAKGTLSPQDIYQLTGKKYDLILPTSAFKGRKNDKNQEIKPGEYNLEIGLGLKTNAQHTKHSLGVQILVNYPEAVQQDILPLLRKRIEELKEMTNNLIAIRHDFLKTSEDSYRQQLLAKTDLNDFLEELTKEESKELIEKITQSENQLLMYRLLSSDRHYQLLEHPKVVDFLNDYLHRQYLEAATGRFVKFNSAMLQPSRLLKPGEFCAPDLPDGEEAIVTRSPLVNSNGVIVLRNRHIEELMEYEGVAWMNPGDCASLQADFDGDRIAYELAAKFPSLAAEVKEKLLPENRYAEVQKQDKIEYQGTFEEIALSACKNSIGIVARQIMKTVALECETFMMPENIQDKYVRDLSVFYQNLLQENADLENTFQIPPELKKIKPKIQEIAEFNRNSRSTKEKLEVTKHFLHNLVDLLSNELQIAVDGPKSARRPNSEILKYCDKLTAYKPVSWLEDYKAEDVYRHRPLSSNNYSPIDLLVQPVNEAWQKQVLEPRPTHQFKNLFSDVKYTEEDKKKCKEIKAEYDRLNRLAFTLKDKMSNYPGPTASISTKDKVSLEVVDLISSTHPNTFSLQTAKLKIRYYLDKKQQPYAVMTEVSGEKNGYGKPLYRRIGYLSEKSLIENKKFINQLLLESKSPKKDLGELGSCSIEISPGATTNQVQAALKRVSNFVEQTQNQIPSTKKEAMAAAMWDICTPRTDAQKYRNEENQLIYKKSAAALAIFAKEIGDRLQQFQFKELIVGGIRQTTNEHGERLFTGEKLPIAINFDANPNSPLHNKRIVMVEGKVLGSISPQSPQLPVGTKASARITAEPDSQANFTTQGKNFAISAVGKYDYSEIAFNARLANLSFQWQIDPKGDSKKADLFAHFDGKILGKIIDKNARNYLEQFARCRVPIEGTLERNPLGSIARIEIDPDTIEYPANFIQDKQRKNLQVREETLLPTLIAKEDYEWEISPGEFTELPTTRIAVDNRQLNVLEDYFKRNGISYDLARSRSDIGIEKQLGYDVVRIVTDNIPTSIQQKLVEKFGEPLNAHYGGSYYQELEAIADREYQHQEASTNSLIQQMVSGSGPWRGVNSEQIEETFLNRYVPLLDKAIAAKLAPPINIHSGSDSPLGAALTNATETQVELDRVKTKEFSFEELIARGESWAILSELKLLPSPLLVDYIEKAASLSIDEYDEYDKKLSTTDILWLAKAIQEDLLERGAIKKDLSEAGIHIPQSLADPKCRYIIQLALDCSYEKTFELAFDYPGDCTNIIKTIIAFEEKAEEWFKYEELAEKLGIQAEILKDDFLKKYGKDIYEYVHKKALKALKSDPHSSQRLVLEYLTELGIQVDFLKDNSNNQKNTPQTVETSTIDTTYNSQLTLQQEQTEIKTKHPSLPTQSEIVSTPPDSSDTLTSLPPLPLEFMPNSIKEQLERTKIVAEILSAYLQAYNKCQVQGEYNTVTWNGKELILTDSKSKLPKMVATYEQGDWVAQPVTYPSLGLSEDDVKYFQNLVPAIKKKILENSEQQQQNPSNKTHTKTKNSYVMLGE